MIPAMASRKEYLVQSQIGLQLRSVEVTAHNVRVQPKNVNVKIENVGVPLNPIMVAVQNISMRPKKVRIRVRKCIYYKKMDNSSRKFETEVSLKLRHQNEEREKRLKRREKACDKGENGKIEANITFTIPNSQLENLQNIDIDGDLCPRKKVPFWTWKNNIVDQSDLDPDAVFKKVVLTDFEFLDIFLQPRAVGRQRLFSLNLDLEDLDLTRMAEDMHLV